MDKNNGINNNYSKKTTENAREFYLRRFRRAIYLIRTNFDCPLEQFATIALWFAYGGMKPKDRRRCYRIVSQLLKLPLIETKRLVADAVEIIKKNEIWGENGLFYGGESDA